LALRREIVGIILVALIASTTLTLFIIGERADTMVEILENTFPAAISHDRRNTFSLGIIARKPMKHLDIEVTTLQRLDLELLDINITEQGRDAMLAVGMVSDLRDLSLKLNVDPVEYEFENVAREMLDYDIYVMDFTDAVRPLIDGNTLSGYSGMGTTTIYAGLFNESGLALLYAGSMDFFPSRNVSIAELTYSFNDEKEVFKRMKELSPAEISSGVPTLLDAPVAGKLSLSDLAKDDTVRLTFSVDRSTIGGKHGYLPIYFNDNIEFIRVFSNGEVVEKIANWCITV
jgi:hypothetical protein